MVPDMEHSDIEERITSYLLGDLTEAESERIRTHLQTCEGCRALAQELELTLDLVRGALAADAEAPVALSPERRERIRAAGTPPVEASGFRLDWVQPWMWRAAGLAAIVVVLACLLAPAFQRDSTTLASRNGSETQTGAEAMESSRKAVEPERTAPPPPEAASSTQRVGEAGRPQAVAAGEDATEDPADLEARPERALGENLEEQTEEVRRLERVRMLGVAPMSPMEAPPAMRGVERLGDAIQEHESVEEPAEDFDAAAEDLARFRVALADDIGAPGVSSRATRVDMEGRVAQRRVAAEEPAVEVEFSLSEESIAAEAGGTSTFFIGSEFDVKEEAPAPAPGPAPRRQASNTEPEPTEWAGIQVQLYSVAEMKQQQELSLGLEEGAWVTYAYGTWEDLGLTTAAVEDAAVQDGQENQDEQDDPAAPDVRALGRRMAGDYVAEAEPFDFARSDLAGSDLAGPKPAMGTTADADSDQTNRIAPAGGVRGATRIAAIPAQQNGVLSMSVTGPASADEPDPGFVSRGYGVNPFVTVAEDPISTFAVDVDTASYTLVRAHLLRGRLPPPEAVRTEQIVNYFDYGYRAPRRTAFAVETTLAPTSFGEGRLLRIGVHGRRLGRDEHRPAVLTFVVDTSGSMDAPDRWGLARESLGLLLDGLGAEDRVAIVQVDSQARLLLPHTPAAERTAIEAVLDSMQCSGATQLEEGIRLGYQVAADGYADGAVNRVILLSDGAANLGSADPEEVLAMLETYRGRGIHCSVFGFGTGTYNDPMLEQLANRGGGPYRFVDSLEEARRLFVDELSTTLQVLASDVKIQVEFDPARVTSYRQLGYENRQLTREQSRDVRVDAGDVGSGESMTALYEVLPTAETGGPLGVVRLRFRDTDSGEVRELAHPIAADGEPTFEAADTQFRLAAAAAEFAEILRGSPFAEDGSHQAVAEVLRPVAMELQSDARVQELLRLVQRADELMRE